ncbi:MAG: bifunctional adenosylcobinamide kinase/adenosylcobinamide-phosphate guanylyltransferase [Ferrimicrobium sp.]|uniref:bifunctional adenosylcobinamide kinase/adenosylcobinamide-phosphate guanylyltransferase n=1 Tax=Ferrimicrobium sp. TaxID=2926050 RepID=UPI0023F1EEAB|nr:MULTISPECIES: bifunctional adenosylcobinamide kinase/adenosylcobinamide-phosphate guanylyltransferase [Ferrimicrobium]
MSPTTLVLGGTRSGKSAFAESLLDNEPAVHYIATLASSSNPSFTERVALHQRRRGPRYSVLELEEPRDLVRLLAFDDHPVLLDSIGTWLARIDVCETETIGVLTQQLIATLRVRRMPLVIVSEEVGLAVHPVTAAGRCFVDVLGAINQTLAREASQVFLVVAGIPIALHEFRHGG